MPSSDDYKDAEQRSHIERWVPQAEADEKGWDGDLRWNIVRARAAEARVSELEQGLRDFGALLKSVGVRL